MERTFRAEKMLARVRREGKGELLDKETVAFIKSLDGKVGNDNNWRSVVHDEPLVWIDGVKTEDGIGVYVAACDCD